MAFIKKYKKYKKIEIFLYLVFFVFIIISIIFAHPYSFDRDWIIGRTYSEIEAKYGMPDISIGDLKGYEVPKSIFEKIWDKYVERQTVYYYIVFNENDIAILVKNGAYPGG